MTDISAQERRMKILEILHKNGKVKVNDLSRRFAVSEVSIRADLAELEGKQLLSRIHGGAISSYKAYYNMSLSQRSSVNENEKLKIAEAVAEMVEDNDTLIMNAGTTPLFVMRALKKKNLTIVTNSIAIALEAGKFQNLKVILLGGEVNSEYQFTYGTAALKSLSEYHADKLILSVDGINTEKGLSTFYFQEADICKKMIEQSKTVIIAADYTKIGRVAFSSITSADAADIVVTNKNSPSDEISGLKACGIKIVKA